MSFFSPGELSAFRGMADSAMPDTAVVLRPDYAGSASPTTVATTICRVVRYEASAANVLDITGEASYSLHLPAGLDIRAGDEILVNGAERYVVITGNLGRTYDYDTSVAVKREA